MFDNIVELLFAFQIFFFFLNKFSELAVEIVTFLFCILVYFYLYYPTPVIFYSWNISCADFAIDILCQFRKNHHIILGNRYICFADIAINVLYSSFFGVGFVDVYSR